MRLPAFVFSILLLLGSSAAAEDTLMARVDLKFDTALDRLQTIIVEHGYKVVHVQRCDVGLEHSGYQTDKYRIVFFAKLEELRAISAAHPELVPYLPLNIAIYAEGHETILSVFNPAVYERFFPQSGLSVQFHRWENDVRSIMDEMRVRGSP